MAKKLLITQCLQNDFVSPLGPYDSLPNLLHIGYHESLRLIGEYPDKGPVAQMMNWAYGIKKQELDIIHIRDWHNKDDNKQRSHLEYFGAHCLMNTPGAEFAFNVPDQSRATLVNALTLNDFIDSNLAVVLKKYEGEKVDVGLIGVWTEAKITFLTYELTTRFPQFNIGICSALTAGSSRNQHFIALNQLGKIFGVKVYDSLGEFTEFLGSEKSTSYPIQNFNNTLHNKKDFKVLTSTPVNPEALELMHYLFRDCRQVNLKPLDGGFSGNYVLGSESIDQYGHRQVPHVVKIGPRKLIASERTAFERIESVLGNNAPQIIEFADLNTYGAIKYRYASMGGEASSFQKIYQKGHKLHEVKEILSEIFKEQLGRLYAAAELESCNLFSYYGFSPNISSQVKATALKAGASEEEANTLSDFYEHDLPTLLKETHYHYFSYVHGDLNGANIIIDSHENIWLIDFFHAHRGHILKDLIKLENDILYIYTPIRNKSEMINAIEFSKELIESDDLWKMPSFKRIPKSTVPLKRTAETIKHLRSFYKDLVRSDRSPVQLNIAQLRYAVHTLVFDECNKWQKKWALHMALCLVDRIREYEQISQILRIDWLRNTKGANVGLTLLPGRKDKNRNLETDLQAIKEAGITDVVCLVTDTELKRYGVEKICENYKSEGINVWKFPIPDGKVPEVTATKQLVKSLNSVLTNKNNNILIHCVGGLGRSGLLAACLAKSWGLKSKEAIELVRHSRSQRAIETVIQENFVKGF